MSRLPLRLTYGAHVPATPGRRGNETDLRDAMRSARWARRIAAELGADAVGICGTNRRWFRPDGREQVPADHAWTVVMGVAMDRAAIDLSPGPEAAAATRDGYARMEACAPALGEAIAAMGYHAVSAGNGLASSVPLAVAAGLGEVGLHGMLITPDHSACVRLCKVFTNMPLAQDAPVELGVRRFCQNCGRCARACPPSAVAEASDHTNPEEADRWWSVDGQTCRRFWRELGHSCANCVAACLLFPSRG